MKLVMVGIHVGSTKGHGEMVWGSFEHADNAPDATYKYNSTQKRPVLGPRDRAACRQLLKLRPNTTPVTAPLAAPNAPIIAISAKSTEMSWALYRLPMSHHTNVTAKPESAPDSA